MQSMVGTMVIAQEDRFQLLDRNGVGHLFQLHHRSSIEADQLPPLLHRQVRVSYRPGDPAQIIAHAAVGVDLLED